MKTGDRKRCALAALLLAAAVVVPGAAAAAAGRPSARPSLPDADGDGLPDTWERHGVTLDGGAGRHFIDLPAMGADPRRPDLFLQVDWMADDAHDQRPRPEALAMLVEAFAGSPYDGATGTVGITVHIDAGSDSVLAPGRTWGELSRARPVPWRDQIGTAAKGSYDWTEFLHLKDAPGGFTETGRAAVFHYAVFGHYHDRDDPRGSGASGIARGIGGTDLLVTLGNFTDAVGTAREQAASLMHELGHNLGLRHGGCDDKNFKPGYSSVMNYTYQMTGVVRGGEEGVLDYSRGLEPVLDEALAEPPATPVSGATARAAACVGTGEVRAGLAVPTVAPVADAAADGACEGGAPFHDWAHVQLRAGTIGRPTRARRR